MNLPAGKIDFSISKERTALLLCIGISLLIWVFLKLSKEYSTTRTVHLEYEVPALMEFTETPPSAVTATVKGVGLELAKKILLHGTPTITLDLSEFSSPEIQRDIIMRKIEEKTELTVVNINRNYLRFAIDSTATKKVPVHLDLAIDYKPDFYLRQPVKLSADSVLVSGSAKELAEITSIETEKLHCESVSSDLKKKVKLKTGQYNTVKTYPDEIEVNILVEQYTEKSIEVPIQAVNVKDSVQLLPALVTITSSVGLSHYDGLNADDFVVEADFGNGIKPRGKNNVP
ncbi:MAG TPA: hypothetical protein ENJ95_10230, partial [Bacteroidetes bacterium]|nr:hypothetical protein [Bacteroidota bacterium]